MNDERNLYVNWEKGYDKRRVTFIVFDLSFFIYY